MIDAEIYGIIFNAKIVILPNAPPENISNMPNIPPAEQMLARLKQQRTAMLQQQQGGDARIANIERKLDALMKHLGVPPVLPIPPQGVQPPTNIKNEKDKTNQIKTTGKVETKGK